jgi:hypothetical protein
VGFDWIAERLFTTTPTSGAVSVGQTIPVTLGWAGLAAGDRFQYTNPAVIGQTIVGVSTR